MHVPCRKCDCLIEMPRDPTAQFVVCPDCGTRYRLNRRSAGQPSNSSQESADGPPDQTQPKLRLRDEEPLPAPIAPHPDEPPDRADEQSREAAFLSSEKYRNVEEPRGLARGIADAFAYPLGKEGRFIVLAAALFFTAAEYLGYVLSLIPFVGIIAIIIKFILIGACVGYLMEVIHRSSLGEKDAPDWPDLTDLWDSAIRPLLTVGFVLLVCISPAIIYHFAVEDGNVLKRDLLLLPGAVAFPMILLCLSIRDDIAGLNPLVLVRALAAAPIAYAIVWLVGFLSYVALFMLTAAISPVLEIPVLGDALAFVFTFYWLLFAGRLIGMFYYNRRDKLDWLTS